MSLNHPTDLSEHERTVMAEEQARMLEQVTRHVFLVALHVGWPKLAHQIADAVVEITTAEGEGDAKKTTIDAELRTNPQWNLMPKEWRQRMGNIESRGRRALQQRSIKFSTAGMALLPIGAAAETFTSLRELREEFQSARDEFENGYVQILYDLRATLGDELYEKAAERLPKPADIADKFSFTWAIIPMGGSPTQAVDTSVLEGTLNELVELEDLVRMHIGGVPRMTLAIDTIRGDISQVLRHQQRAPRAIDEGFADELIAEARQQMSAHVSEFVENMAREPRAALVDAVDNLLEAIGDDSRIIRTGTINQVEQAFRQVRDFSFLADDELLSRINTMQTRLDEISVRDLNADVEIGARLAEGLQHVRDQANNVEVRDMSVRAFRGINLGRGRQAATPATADDEVSTPALV
jgi:hypothetical protein